MFIRLNQQYRRLCLDSRVESLKVSQMERGTKGTRISDDLDTLSNEERNKEIEQRELAEKRWIRACTELMDRHNGMAISKAVKGLCFSDGVQAHGEFMLAKQGLAILAKHFGLMQSRSSNA